MVEGFRYWFLDGSRPLLGIPDPRAVTLRGQYLRWGWSNLHSTLLPQPSFRPTRPLSKNGPYNGDAPKGIRNSSSAPCVSAWGGWLPTIADMGFAPVVFRLEQSILSSDFPRPVFQKHTQSVLHLVFPKRHLKRIRTVNPAAHAVKFAA